MSTIMNESLNLEPEYLCLYCKVSMSKSLLLSHLSLNGKHRLSKNNQPLHTHEHYKKLIAEKFLKLLDIQSQIYNSSSSLIQSIIFNTQKVLSRIDELVKLYRNILSNPNQNLQEIEIKSNFHTDSVLNKALTDHFKQKILVQSSSAERKTKIIKTKISKLLENKCDYFFSLAVSKSEDFLVTGAQSGIIRIWDMNNNTQRFCLKKHKGSTIALAISLDDNLMLSGSYDCTVRLWDLNAKQHLHVFKGHNNIVSSVLISEDKKTGFSGSWDGTLKIWNLETKELERNITELNNIYRICLCFNETLIACVNSRGLIFWQKNLENFTEVSNNSISTIVFSKDDQYFITGDINGVLKIWLSKTFKIIFKDTQSHSNQIKSITFTACFKYFATCSSDKKAKIWDFENKIVVKTLDFMSDLVHLYFLKLQDILIILQNPNVITHYNLLTNESRDKIKPKKLFLQTIAISSDLMYMAYGTASLNLYEIDTIMRVKKICHGENECNYIKFSPDNSFLGLGFNTGQILIFKVPCLEKLQIFHFCNSKIISLSFSMNNKYLACGYHEKNYFVQAVDTNEVIYSEERIYVLSSVFCFNDKRLVISVFQFFIHVLNEKFEIVANFNVNYIIFRLLVSKNDKDVFISDCQSFFSCMNSKTCELKERNQKIKDFKKMNLKDLKLKVFLSLPRINIS